MKPLEGYSGRILRSTSDLIDVMKTVTVNDDELLVSYDVKSLFTSIPVKESIEVCEERLRQDSTLADRTSMDVETIIGLLRFCLTSTSFQYGENTSNKWTVSLWGHLYPLSSLTSSWKTWR